MPDEGRNLANHKSQKFGVFNRKVEGGNILFLSLIW